MDLLKKSNKIGGSKYEFLVRCVLLVPHSRTGLHWYGASGNPIPMGSCVLLVPHSRTGLHWSGVSGSHISEAIEQKAIFHTK